MKLQELQLLISACNQFCRLAGKETEGLVFGLYPIELVLNELQAKKKIYGANTNFSLIEYRIVPENSNSIAINIDMTKGLGIVSYNVWYPNNTNIKYFNLTEALEAVLNYMNISPEDLKDRFEKPDFMGEQFMPEDYV